MKIKEEQFRVMLSTCWLDRRAVDLLQVETCAARLEEQGLLDGVPPARLVQLLFGIGDLLASELLVADRTGLGELLHVFGHCTPP